MNDDKEVWETLNSYFGNIVTTLDIKENTNITENVPTDLEPVDQAIITNKRKSK